MRLARALPNRRRRSHCPLPSPPASQSAGRAADLGQQQRPQQACPVEGGAPLRRGFDNQGRCSLASPVSAALPRPCPSRSDLALRKSHLPAGAGHVGHSISRIARPASRRAGPLLETRAPSGGPDRTRSALCCSCRGGRSACLANAPAARETGRATNRRLWNGWRVALPKARCLPKEPRRHFLEPTQRPAAARRASRSARRVGQQQCGAASELQATRPNTILSDLALLGSQPTAHSSARLASPRWAGPQVGGALARSSRGLLLAAVGAGLERARRRRCACVARCERTHKHTDAHNWLA